MEEKIKNIRNELSIETRFFLDQSQSRENQLAEIQAELVAIQKGKATTIEVISNLQQRIIQLEADQKEQAMQLTAKYKLLHKIENSARYEADTNKNKSLGRYKSDINEPVVTDKLAYLELGSIMTSGSHNIAIFSNELSEEIEVKEDDVIGHFKIMNINPNNVSVVDTLGNRYTINAQ